MSLPVCNKLLWSSHRGLNEGLFLLFFYDCYYSFPLSLFLCVSALNLLLMSGAAHTHTFMPVHTYTHIHSLSPPCSISPIHSLEDLRAIGVLQADWGLWSRRTNGHAGMTINRKNPGGVVCAFMCEHLVNSKPAWIWWCILSCAYIYLHFNSLKTSWFAHPTGHTHFKPQVYFLSRLKCNWQTVIYTDFSFVTAIV